MRKKNVITFFALISLCSIAVLGKSPELFSNLIESIQNNPITNVFSSPNSAANIVTKAGKSKRTSSTLDSTEIEIPEHILWQVVFDFTRKIENKAEELNRQGQDSSLFSNYFIRQGPLSPENNLTLKEKASQYFQEIDTLDQKAKKITEEAKAENTNNPEKELESFRELKQLQTQKEEISLRYKDMIRTELGEETFNKFQLFLKTDFSEGATVTVQKKPQYRVG